MQRRAAIKYLFVVAGGVVVIPSCLNKKSPAINRYSKLTLSEEDEATTAAVAETILPAGKSPGALDTGAHLFALKMINDCSGPDVQKSFLIGLKAFKAHTDKSHGRSFAQCTVPQQQQLIEALEMETEENDMVRFYKTFKQYTIRGYLNSKPVLGTILDYKLVPGKYNGSAPVQQIIYPA